MSNSSSSLTGYNNEQQSGGGSGEAAELAQEAGGSSASSGALGLFSSDVKKKMASLESSFSEDQRVPMDSPDDLHSGVRQSLTRKKHDGLDMLCNGYTIGAVVDFI